jgi:hypothetical protein
VGIIRALLDLAEVVHPTDDLHLVTAKDDDNHPGMRSVGEADFVVTGDRANSPPARVSRQARITPADFLDLLDPVVGTPGIEESPAPLLRPKPGEVSIP